MELISIYIITIIIILIIIIINIIIGEKIKKKEKIKPYECGIIPIGENRIKINIEYIIIGILYIIFDIEIILIIPYTMTENKIYTY
jgi:NADH:ubiquinone oxidoreductase subunit 3 (subunit A)